MRNLIRDLASALTLAEFELRKLRHDSSQIWIRGVQPALWLLVFGEAFSAVRGIPTDGFTYLQFMTPGVLAQSVMFVAIFYGIALVWERDMGLLSKLLSTPVPRSSIVLGKALSASVRGIFQALVVLALALIIGIDLSVNLLSVLGVFFVIVLFSMCFSCLSMCFAPIFRTRDRMMGIGQAITMPLFFASNAIYPTSIMPGWLKTIIIINPLSYAVDAMRALLVTGDFSNITIDLLALFIATSSLATLASITLKRMVS
jgi:ABC-2 type transport system permease protein